MTPQQIAKFRRVVTKAIEAHLSKPGNSLAAGTFGGESCMCPISCVVDPIQHSSETVLTYENALSLALSFSITSDQLFSFTDYFDRKDPTRQRITYDPDFAALGTEFRNKYDHCTHQKEIQAE